MSLFECLDSLLGDLDYCLLVYIFLVAIKLSAEYLNSVDIFGSVLFLDNLHSC